MQGTVVGDRPDRDGSGHRHRDGRDDLSPRRRRPHEGLQLAPNAPDSYIVKRGDTLWGIAKVFLQGSLVLAGDLAGQSAGAEPALDLSRATRCIWCTSMAGRESCCSRAVSSAATAHGCMPRVRSQPLEAAVTTIPYETVAAFMSKPSVLEKEQIKTAPYVLVHARLARGHVGGKHRLRARLHRSGRARHALQSGARRRGAARSGRQPHPRLQRGVHGHRPRHPRRRPGDTHHDPVDARDLPRRQALARAMSMCRSTSCRARRR